MITDEQVSTASRALAAALEPFAGSVYFAPECHKEYEALGFGPSPAMNGAVQMPDGPAYFTSRGSVMGKVPGEVVAATFGVFNPDIVVAAVQRGWQLTDAETICAARDRGAVNQLRRILGPTPAGLDQVHDLLRQATEPLAPAGKPLYAGLRSLPVPDDALGAAWRLADMLREYRGDAHIAAWTAQGLDGCEISLLTDAWWGLPIGSYARTRAWGRENLEAGKDRLRGRGLIDGDAITESGRSLRSEIERTTDLQMRPALAALGVEAATELTRLLERWGQAVRDAGGYLPTGPHDMAAEPQ